MSRIVDRLVVQSKADWVPSLLDFRVDVICAVVIGIDSFENGNVNFVDMGLESIMEDDFEVRVVVFVGSEVCWRSSTIEGNVAKGKLRGLVRLRS